MDETWEDRVNETLAYLERTAAHTFRTTSEGQRIEAVGCILSGRSSWWIDSQGNGPEVDRSPSFVVNDETQKKEVEK